jgi:hypothetical protein
MMIQTYVMAFIAILCFISALDWVTRDQYASAIAFIGFGFGYVGLAVLFRSVT